VHYCQQKQYIIQVMQNARQIVFDKTGCNPILFTFSYYFFKYIS